MPVSHLGLTVSHIPSATSFYLGALQPLGYRYIGTQGDSIGLGIDDADFFLCQEASGSRVAPTHIAFAASSRLAVRDCYAAALNGGGTPSGAPSYRNNDCSCFNAAVHDPDGNTIEFIFREGVDPCQTEKAGAPSEAGTRITAWQNDVAESAADLSQSIESRINQAKSRAETAVELASTTSRSMKQAVSGTTTPTGNNQSGKTIIGTFLGAAAGAAFAYAMCKSEEDDSAVRSSRGSKRGEGSLRRAMSAGKSAAPRSTADTAASRPRSTRMIETGGGYDDRELQDVLSRYTAARSRPPMPARSQTYDDAVEYVPAASAARSRMNGNPSPSMASGRSSKHGLPARSQTAPEDVPHYYLDPPRSTASRRTERTGPPPSERRSSDEALKLKRHDSAMSMHSHRTRTSDESPRKSSAGESSKRSQQPSKVGSTAPSQTSTVKPPSRPYPPSAAQVPLPASAPVSRNSSYRTLKDLPNASSYFSARDRPPASSRGASYVSAKDVQLPPSITGKALYADPVDDDEDDGLGDLETVVPDDSISCVGLDKSERSSRRSGTSSRSRRPEKEDRRSKYGSSGSKATAVRSGR